MSQIKFYMLNNNIPAPPVKKMKRKNFFLYSAMAAIGAVIFSKLPFKFIKQEATASHGKIRISTNPYAVSRKQGAVRNG